MSEEFTWTDSMDHEIDESGVIFLKGEGRSKAIQRFCEDLSRLVQYKCDWAFLGGRFYMKVMPEGLSAVEAALENLDWVMRYCVRYSQDSINDNTFFKPYITAILLDDRMQDVLD